MKKRKTYFLVLVSVVTIFVFAVILFYTTTLKVTLVNDTKEIITDVVITGCKSKEIGVLQQGESKTIWLFTADECAINLEYVLNNSKHSEVIDGYVVKNITKDIEYQMGKSTN